MSHELEGLITSTSLLLNGSIVFSNNLLELITGMCRLYKLGMGLLVSTKMRGWLTSHITETLDMSFYESYGVRLCGLL